MFRRILIWFGGMLLFSFTAYIVTSFWLNPHSKMRDDIVPRLMRFQFAEAVRAYEGGGQPALGELLFRVNSQFQARHHLLDQNGRDLVTGQDFSALEREAGKHHGFRLLPPRHFVVESRSPNGLYRYLVEAEAVGDPWSNMAVYGWIVLVVVLLCYALAWTLAKPIRQLHQTVVRFGQGDLSSRARSDRSDEVGDLARAFDQMADRLETLLTAERRLLQDISHELRSPLARLRFALQLAKSSREPESAFARVDREVERLSTLVGELLQVTRAEGDAGSRNLSHIHMRDFLEGLVEDCRIEAQPRGCSIDLCVKQDPVWSGDRELLHRAIENVLRNAIHYAPRGTTVDVDAATEEGRLVLQVRDYGSGVPPEDLEQIFRPFFRVEDHRGRENGSGVGLGLAIAERAIRVHHGEIHARNAAPGLLVEMRLPL